MNKKTLNIISIGLHLLSFTIAYLIFRHMRYLSGLTHIPIWFLPFIVIAAIVVFSVAVIKQALVKAMETPPTLRTVSLEDYPQLDMNAFNYYDTELTRLGFQPRFCYTSSSTVSGSIQGLARVYFHPLHKCLAENAQIFKCSTRIAWSVIMSQLDDGWSLSNSNMKANPVQCILRKPRALWKTVHRGTPGDLLDTHLRIRQQMLEGLYVSNITADSEQAYFHRQIDNHERNRKALAKKSAIFITIEMELYKRMPISLWIGELKKVMKNRPGFQRVEFRG